METNEPATASPADASGLHVHLGFWLRLVSNQVSGRFRRLLEERDIGVAEWVALRTLYASPHTSHAALTLALGMTKSATSKIVSRLEQKYLARRDFAEGSAREQRLSLTPKGRELVPQLAALADENEAHFFGHLSHEDRDALMRAFRALVEHHGFRNVPVE